MGFDGPRKVMQPVNQSKLGHGGRKTRCAWAVGSGVSGTPFMWTCRTFTLKHKSTFKHPTNEVILHLDDESDLLDPFGWKLQ